VEPVDEPVLASDCSLRVGEAGVLVLGEACEALLADGTPLTVTLTVSMLPAPFGPWIVSVPSVCSSPSLWLPPALTPLLLPSHGIGVRSAPPRLSSLPRPFRSWMPLFGLASPFVRKPLFPPIMPVGRGKSDTGELTDTTRSRARR
jgi:hypothetical protein